MRIFFYLLHGHEMGKRREFESLHKKTKSKRAYVSSHGHHHQDSREHGDVRDYFNVIVVWQPWRFLQLNQIGKKKNLHISFPFHFSLSLDERRQNISALTYHFSWFMRYTAGVDRIPSNYKYESQLLLAHLQTRLENLHDNHGFDDEGHIVETELRQMCN